MTKERKSYEPQVGDRVRDLVHNTEGVVVGTYKQEKPECLVYRVKIEKPERVVNLRDYEMEPMDREEGAE